MNDNEPLGDFGVPEWAEEIIETHDLGMRADCPRAAVTVLLTDAAFDLKDLALTVFREQAVTPETLQRMIECAAMINDAVKLAPLCPDQPESGAVTELDDGTLAWGPEGLTEG